MEDGMKRLRLLLLCVMVLGISLSCKTITGTTDKNSDTESTWPTKVSLPIQKPGGLITKVTMAHGAEPETYEPVDPATEFLPTDTIHAIVIVKKAPADTLFTAKWFSIDIDLEGRDNELLDTTELQTGGTGNLDFSFAPQGEFPTGSYRVEIYVNNNLDQVKTYQVIAGE
jgi:hypothetical protein